MAKPTGFLDYDRLDAPKRPVEERVRDYREIEQRMSESQLEIQAARCMDCGIPYCHAIGCPLGNRIPDFNDMVYRRQWRYALDILHSSNNFPEITGRVCPALCEAACTLALNADAVTIRQIELHLVERGWREGWIQPEPAPFKTGARVAIVGSGPAGLAAAQQLARQGHDVVMFEQDDRIGGILRYGIPDFKLEKWLIDRRLDQMREEGVTFRTGTRIGSDVPFCDVFTEFNATLLAMGCREPRDLNVPGRELNGIHIAMDFLTQQNRRSAGETVPDEETISARGKRVVVIGGGDTGADCVGTSRRQGATAIVQIELLPEPPAERAVDNPWPTWPYILRTSSSHEEGCERLWSILTKEFLGENGTVRALRCVKLAWHDQDSNGQPTFSEIAGSEFELDADLILLAMGFVGIERSTATHDVELALTDKGNIAINECAMTSLPTVFAAGDCVSGPSLVVSAIKAGREAAAEIESYLAY